LVKGLAFVVFDVRELLYDGYFDYLARYSVAISLIAYLDFVRICLILKNGARLVAYDVLDFVLYLKLLGALLFNKVPRRFYLF